MATVIKMPSVVADATSAVLQKWLVQVGDPVNVGDPIADIETEKATVELEAEAVGTMDRLLVEEGVTVPVGDPIAVLKVEGDDDAALEVALADVGSPSGPLAAPEVAPTTDRFDDAAASQPVSAETTPKATEETPRSSHRIPCSPLARRRARELGVDLKILKGSGPGGRILRADVEAAPVTAETPSTPVAASTPTTAPTAGGVRDDAEQIPVTGMRATIARRLTESKTTVPHFYLSVDVEMDALMALRSQVNRELAEGPELGHPAAKVTVNDLCLKALGRALVDVPEANAAWNGDYIRRFRSVDVSVAIAIDGGLVTPVVAGLQEASLTSVSRTMRDFKERAATSRIKQRELEGGSFSLTNLGMFGTREFSAILNPPQAGILALGASEERPVARQGEIAVATIMTATFSADHRVIDGAVAARLAAAFKRRIEQPLSLLL